MSWRAQNKQVLIPNVLGLLLSFVQLSLFAMYEGAPSSDVLPQ